MKKKLFVIVTLAALGFTACNTNETKNTENTTDEPTEATTTDEAKVLNVADFYVVAANYANKEVTVKGVVEHTCKHGGKKMFILDPQNEEANALKITTEKSFDVSLEGSIVEVTGVVEELIVNEATIAELEAQIKKEHGELEVNEEEHDPNQGQMGQLKMMKKMLEDNQGKEVKNYTLSCVSYKVAEK